MYFRQGIEGCNSRIRDMQSILEGLILHQVTHKFLAVSDTFYHVIEWVFRFFVVVNHFLIGTLLNHVRDPFFVVQLVH